MKHSSPFEKTMSKQDHCPWLLWLAYAAVLGWLWPGRVVVRGDDFGYLESVTETVRHGMLVSSDWVEPLNLVLPLLSTAIWHFGGSFYLATIGLMAALAVLNFHLLWIWVRPWLVDGWTGHLIVLAIALLPVGLNKAIEFTGVPVGLVFFIGALLAWRRQSPTVFFLLVLVGYLNRQSAVCLLTLPIVAQFCAWRCGRSIDWRWISGALGVGLLAGLVMIFAPDTLARAITARHQDFTGRMVGQFLLGFGLLGGIAASWAWLQGSVVASSWRGLFKNPVPVIFWLVLGAGLLMTDSVTLRCETPGLWSYGPLVVTAALVVAATVPLALVRLAPEALVATTIYAMLVAWRGVWWDYYLCEPVLLLGWRAIPREVVSGDAWSARAAGVACAVVTLVGLLPIRYQLHWAESRVVNYESALRAGRLDITAASEAPFGFLGWKVFPAMATRLDEPGLRLSDFVKYIEAGRSHLGPEGIVLLPPLTEPRSLHHSGELWPLPSEFRSRKFPLNDDEWKDWLVSSQP